MRDGTLSPDYRMGNFLTHSLGGLAGVLYSYGRWYEPKWGEMPNADNCYLKRSALETCSELLVVTHLARR